MTKNKGSFWKNNIKKIKKERKERSIKQEAQKKKARIKIEAQKKAREEIERKESKRLLQEEAERKEIQKTYEKEQEEEAKRIREAKEEAERRHVLLLDTMIVHDVFTDNMDVITKLKNYEGGNNLLFLVLDRIILEFINMRKEKFGESVEHDKIIEKLSLLGEIKEIRLNWVSPVVYKAKEIESSGKYKNETTGVALSETDCILLQHAIDYLCTLVTDDGALINAASENEGDVFNPRKP